MPSVDVRVLTDYMNLTPPCTPWTYTGGVDPLFSINYTYKKDAFLYSIWFPNIGARTYVAKMNADTGALIASLSDADFGLDAVFNALTSDDTYLYILAQDNNDNSVWFVRVLLADFTTFNTLNLPADFGRQCQQPAVDSGWLYSPMRGGGNTQKIIRLLTADFATVQRLTFSDGNPTWNKTMQGFEVDSNFLYVNATLSGGAANNTFEISRVTKATFTYLDSAVINTGAALASKPGLGNLSQDANFLYQSNFNMGNNFARLTKIDKPTMLSVGTQAYALGVGRVFLWSADGGNTYIYLGTNNTPTLVRVDKSNLATFDVMTLPFRDVTAQLTVDDGFYMGVSNNNGGSGVSEIHKICDFIPD